jgi:pentatricopeptide repeat protein
MLTLRCSWRVGRLIVANKALFVVRTFSHNVNTCNSFLAKEPKTTDLLKRFYTLNATIDLQPANWEQIDELFTELCAEGSVQLANECFRTILTRHYVPKISPELVLANIRENNVEMAMVVFNTLSRLTETSQKAIFDELITTNNLVQASHVLKRSNMPSGAQIQTLLDKFLERGELDQMISVFKFAQEKASLTVQMRDTMLIGCIRFGNTGLAHEIMKIGMPKSRSYKGAERVLLHQYDVGWQKMKTKKSYFWFDGKFNVPHYRKEFDSIETKSIKDYTEMVYMYGLYGDFKMIEKLRQDMTAAKISPDVTFVNTLIHFEVTVGDYKKALKTVTNMVSTFKIEPNVETYTMLVKHTVDNQDYESAKQCLELMIEKGVQPDNLLLKIVGNERIFLHGVGDHVRKWIERANQVFGIKPELYEKELEVLCENDLEKAITYFAQVPKKTTYLYHIIMRKVSPSQVIQYASSMMIEDVKHSGFTFKKTLEAALHEKLPLKDTIHLLGGLEQWRRQEYLFVVRSLLKYNRVHDAKQIIGQDQGTMDIMFNYLCKYDTSLAVVNYFEHYKTIHTPVYYHYFKVLLALYNSKSYADAEEYYQQMEKKGLKPDALLLLERIRAFKNTKQYSKLQALIQDIENGKYNSEKHQLYGAPANIQLLQDEIKKLGKK